MVDIEKLIDAAVDLRMADLKAREQGIIGITASGTKGEAFQFYDEKDFARMIKDKEYSIEKFDNEYKYKYTSVISGLKFICITNKLLFKEDKNKIAEDK